MTYSFELYVFLQTVILGVIFSGLSALIYKLKKSPKKNPFIIFGVIDLIFAAITTVIFVIALNAPMGFIDSALRWRFVYVVWFAHTDYPMVILLVLDIVAGIVRFIIRKTQENAPENLSEDD